MRKILCIQYTQGCLVKIDMWMRSSLVVRASDCQCQSRYSPGFDLPTQWNLRAADEAVQSEVEIRWTGNKIEGWKDTVPFIFRKHTIQQPWLISEDLQKDNSRYSCIVYWF